MSQTTTVAPVKGMKFKHARRTSYNGQPEICTVTSVSTAKNLVYSQTSFHTPVRTPLDKFEKFCLEVVSVPAPVAPSTSPVLSKAQCKALHVKAHAAGLAAGEASVPIPMGVVERANPFDDNSAIVRSYAPVMDGVCGFAVTKIRPATSSFARWAKSQGLGRTGYYGGLEIGVNAFGQSMQRKEAFAKAYSEVLREAGINAYPQSRMD